VVDALDVRRVSVRFDARVVVADASFTARHGQVTALLGPNGAGKTTLLRAIAGLTRYDGVIAVDGIDAHSLDRRSRARQIGYVPQQSRLDSPLSVFEVVAQGRHAHRDGLGALKPSDRASVDDALRRTDAVDLASRSFLELSHGERRRVLIARALATGARLVLLDEPTASLDVGYALACFRLIRNLVAVGAAVVVALHDLDHALRFCDAAVLLETGRVAAHGAISDVITAELISRIYGVELVPGGAVGFREAP
jgi:iron complex transport system ATP-binding protein